MTVRFACGHTTTVDDGATTSPTCLCGETRVSRVTVRPPTFRGACQGPYATTQSVGSAVIDAAPSGPLLLKDTNHG